MLWRHDWRAICARKCCVIISLSPCISTENGRDGLPLLLLGADLLALTFGSANKRAKVWVLFTIDQVG